MKRVASLDTHTAARPRVGVIGLGRMGTAIATQLQPHYEVAGWDKRAIALNNVASVPDVAALIRTCQVVISCLPSPVETSAVIEDPTLHKAFSESDTVLVDASTSDPESLRGLAARLGTAGNRIVDAPILGRPNRIGQWTIPIGGEEVFVERVRPVLGFLANRVEHVGSLGSGHAIKLLNNLMFAAINVVTAEAIAGCSYVGVEPHRFVDIVAGSHAATVSPLFKDLAPRMLGLNDEVVFTAALLAKDAELAQKMYKAAGVPARLAPQLADIANATVDAGYGDQDSAAVVNLYQKP